MSWLRNLALTFKNYLLKNVFIYFWLHWVFLVVCGLLIEVVSLVEEHRLGYLDFSDCSTWAQLSRMSLAAPWHVESSRTRDQTSVLCIAGWILNHWTTREAW